MNHIAQAATAGGCTQKVCHGWAYVGVGQHTTSSPHKQQIWFLPDTQANAQKTQRAIFANTRTD